VANAHLTTGFQLRSIVITQRVGLGSWQLHEETFHQLDEQLTQVSRGLTCGQEIALRCNKRPSGGNPPLNNGSEYPCAANLAIRGSLVSVLECFKPLDFHDLYF